MLIPWNIAHGHFIFGLLMDPIGLKLIKLILIFTHINSYISVVYFVDRAINKTNHLHNGFIANSISDMMIL